VKSQIQNKTCWVITDGKAGCIRQAEGLATALGVRFNTKLVKTKFRIPLYPSWVRKKMLNFISKDSDQLSEPWPDIAISCGSSTIPLMLNIKKENSGKTYIIYVQNPKQSLKNFDTVIVMEHDRITAKNTIQTDMALHPITKDSLTKAKKEIQKLLPSVSNYENAVIIGGNTTRSKMTEDTCLDLIDKIKFIRNNNKGGLFISPSRRTPSRMIELLNQNFGKEKDIYIVNLQVPYNPYFGILSIVKKIFVTNDSVSMISEACSTGKQAFIIPLKNFKLGKTGIFINNILKKSLVANFTDKPQNNPINNNTQLIAELLKERMIKSGKFKNEDFL
jgi:mitochondrial fission protein ELM1